MFGEHELAWAAGRLSVDLPAAERLPETLSIQLADDEILGADLDWPDPNRPKALCAYWRPFANSLSMSL